MQDDGDIGMVVVDHAHRLALVPLICAFGDSGRRVFRTDEGRSSVCLITTTIGTMVKGQTD